MKQSIIDIIAEGIAWFIVFLAPMSSTMIALLILVVCDFISGLVVAVKKGGTSSVSSAKMSRTVIKLFMYYLAIIAGLACEMIVPGIPFTRVAMGFVAVVELKSIYENVGWLTGTNVWGAVKGMLEKYLRKEEK